jgi:hypothetical protein
LKPCAYVRVSQTFRIGFGAFEIRQSCSVMSVANRKIVIVMIKTVELITIK